MGRRRPSLRRTGRLRRLAAAAGAAALAVTLLGPAPSPAQAATPLPATLSHIGSATQVIVVHSASWSTSYATLEAWQKGGTGWQRVYWMYARIGYNGFVWGSQRKQNSGTTPTGTYTITQLFGNSANPGAVLPYRRVDSNDVWAYDPRCPATYNRWINWWPGRCERVPDWAEKLSSYRTQYAHAGIINFNITDPVLTRGGGIFLHVNGRGATAGCVSVNLTNMTALTRWMRPGVKIVMGPKSVITKV